MTQHDLLYLLLALGLIWTAIWLAVVRSVPHVQDEHIVDEKTAVLRRRVFAPLSVVLIVGFALSLYWAPYASVRSKTIGKADVTIDVAAMQWAWIMNTKEIPAHKIIEFNVTSQDVNHDFAIYNADGDLVTQVQAMPGYTNKLIYKFEKPGEYTIRCLEYCGIGHDLMISKITVVEP